MSISLLAAAVQSVATTSPIAGNIIPGAVGKVAGVALFKTGTEPAVFGPVTVGGAALSLVPNSDDPEPVSYWPCHLAYAGNILAAEQPYSIGWDSGSARAIVYILAADGNAQPVAADADTVTATSISLIVPTQPGDKLIASYRVNGTGYTLTSPTGALSFAPAAFDASAMYRLFEQDADAGETTTITIAKSSAAEETMMAVVVYREVVVSSVSVDDADADEVIDDGQVGFEIAGGNFGAVEGTVTIGGVAATVGGWADALITASHVSGSTKYGAQLLTVIADGGAEGSLEISVSPPAGIGFVDVTNVDNTNIESEPPLTVGKQVRHDLLTNNGNHVSIDENGIITVTLAVQNEGQSIDGDTFNLSIWDPGTLDWGASALQTVNTSAAILSIEVNPAGNQIIVTADEPLFAGEDGFDDLTLELSGGDITATYASGGGTPALVYSPSRTVLLPETGTANYSQPGDGIKNADGNLLASFAVEIVNGSEQEEEPDPDVIAPVITLLGQSTVFLNIGDDYTDAGAIATDNVDGDITANIAVAGTVNTGVAGAYPLTYTVSDAAGNAATPRVRMVYVAPNSPPAGRPNAVPDSYRWNGSRFVRERNI